MRAQSGMFGGWSASGLRLRFRPSCRVGQGLMTVAPWIDIVLVILLFYYVTQSFLVTPGVFVKLPEGPFVEGVRHGVPIVLLSVEGEEGVNCSLFFDEVRYRLGDIDRELAFSRAIEAYIHHGGRTEAVLHADERSPHGMVMRAVNLARSAGIRFVSVTVRPE